MLICKWNYLQWMWSGFIISQKIENRLKTLEVKSILIWKSSEFMGGKVLGFDVFGHISTKLDKIWVICIWNNLKTIKRWFRNIQNGWKLMSFEYSYVQKFRIYEGQNFGFWCFWAYFSQTWQDMDHMHMKQL